jgi:hypothetical protein
MRLKEGGLGFWDIHAFNLAMLAKQAWRLWEKPDSLCAHILQAKYFKDGTMLDVKPKVAMSYTWRSILKGIQLMKQGMVWRVGDGRGLKIWNDPWLPRDASRKPITPRGTSLVTDVDELIDPITGEWDVQLVKDLFWEEDQQVIVAILVFEVRDNMLAWHFDKHGKFSVWSAYKVCRDEYIRSRNCRAAQGGSWQQVDMIWKKIWSLSCPSKVKYFL